MTGYPQFDDGPFPIDKGELPEATIQERCVAFARSHGTYARKFSSPANRSVPDYVMTWQGLTWYVEFKRLGKKPTEQQAEEHKQIREAGGKVWVVDDIDVFRKKFVRTQMMRSVVD